MGDLLAGKHYPTRRVCAQNRVVGKKAIYQQLGSLLGYHAARMNAPPQRSVQKFGGSGVTSVRTVTIWLYLVAAATVLNSLILFKYSRFIDLLIGLSFTQFIDAVFVGMQLEPPGAPWWWTALPAWVLDVPFVLLLLILAVKVSHRRVRATQVSFWIYAFDTLIFTFILAETAIFHAAIRPLVWQSLTLIVHTVGLYLLFRAWRGQPRTGN
jgi:hypothetical protein